VKLPFAIVTPTWNSAGLLEAFLAHYERLGASAIFVADMGSTDETLEILDSPRWSGLVHRQHGLPIEEDPHDEQLRLAQSMLGEGWCLFCDPDEFLVTPNMSLYDTCATGAAHVALPLHNVTARRSVAEGKGEDLSPFGALTLRIDRSHRHSRKEKVTTEPLTPPWIFTEQPGKVVVRVGRALSIARGAHNADVAEGPARRLVRTRKSPAGCYLLHYPFRTYEEFFRKVNMAEVSFSVSGELDAPRKKGGVPRSAWHYHRWFAIRDRGGLYDEYLAQFVPDERVPSLLVDGTLVEDTRVRDFR
jgi:hypothetical protein